MSYEPMGSMCACVCVCACWYVLVCAFTKHACVGHARMVNARMYFRTCVYVRSRVRVILCVCVGMFN